MHWRQAKILVAQLFFLQIPKPPCGLQPKIHASHSRMPRNFDDAGLEIAASVGIKGFTCSESQSQVDSEDEQRAGLKYC